MRSGTGVLILSYTKYCEIAIISDFKYISSIDLLRKRIVLTLMRCSRYVIDLPSTENTPVTHDSRVANFTEGA